MDDPDDYEWELFTGMSCICDICLTCLTADDLPDEHWEDDAWAWAKTAAPIVRERGWKLTTVGELRCPNCVKKHGLSPAPKQFPATHSLDSTDRESGSMNIDPRWPTQFEETYRQYCDTYARRKKLTLRVEDGCVYLDTKYGEWLLCKPSSLDTLWFETFQILKSQPRLDL